jgi:large subunit ribosomal protein L15
MNLHNLKPAKGSVKSSRSRLGRGEGTGHGGTAGRGHKGAKSRSGYSKKIGFEGGQMPLQRRVPKYGFKNRNKVYYKTLNLDSIEEFIASKKLNDNISITDLINANIVSKRDKVKILGRGELKSKISIEAHQFSASAKEGIESAGGTIKTL